MAKSKKNEENVAPSIEKGMKEPIEKKEESEPITVNEKERVDKTSSEKSDVAIPPRDKGPLILGAGLILFGALLLAGRLLRIPFDAYLWPFIFIVPGILIFFSAITSDHHASEGLTILGGILSMLGFVFFLQTVTKFWASWAYAWALVAPTSVGISQVVYGSRKNRESIQAAGKRLIKLGLIMFAVGFVFFELIIGVSGFGLASFGLPIFPIILIFVGGFVLIQSLLKQK